jgi:putative oxidoreductase
MNRYSDLSARILLAVMFFMAGIGKIGAYAGTQGYMESQGVPGMLLPAVIGLEIIGSIMLVVGWKIRYAAFALAGFTILSALMFHLNFADQIQSIMFMKNLAIAGGLLLLVNHGAGELSLDSKMSSQE